MSFCMPFLGFVLLMVLLYIVMLLGIYRSFDLVALKLRDNYRSLRPYVNTICIVLLLIQIVWLYWDFQTGGGCR